MLGRPAQADSYHRSAPASPIEKMEGAVTFLGDFDHVSVIEIGGDYDRLIANPTGGNTFNVTPRQALAQAFLAQHTDSYDFLVVFSGFEFDTGDALAFHAGVQNQVEGIGVPIYDQTAEWGSDGKLQGFIDMAAISRYERNPTRPDFDRVLGTLAHEMMHQWCCFIGLERPGDSAPTDVLLGRDAAHWSFLLDSDASVMYGHDWRDNGDGTFDALAIRTFYSPLDLYLAGFNRPTQVGEAFLIDNPTVDVNALPVQGATLDGIATTFSIDDVIRANGPRVPAAVDAQKRFRLGFIYLVRPDDPIVTDDLAFIETVREAFLARFPLMTGGQGVVEIFPEVVADDGSTGSPEPVTGGPLRPDAADVASALAWLRDRQAAEGFWEDRPGTRLRDTQLALEALLRLDPSFAGVEPAVAWLLDQAETSTDYLARLAVTFDAGAESLDTGGGLAGGTTPVIVRDAARSLRAEIVGRQNTDGGWGVAPGFDSEPLDTALALLALTSSDEADSEIDPQVLAGARDFLLATQDSLGGWGNGQDSPARSTVTTTVLRALAQLDATPSPAAIAFLAGKQNADDGGFGDSPSSVHDTANVLGTLLALDALFALDTVSTIDRVAAEGYLLSRQSVEGSWDGSVYATALAALALEAATRPNLRFDLPIAFDPSAPQDGELVTVALGVQNDGGVGAEATTLDLFDGEPSAGGTVIAAGIVVPALPPNSRVTLTAEWDTTDLGGAHTIFARLDPNEVVDEGSETDNIISAEITVDSPPVGVELVLGPSSIAVTPEQPATLPAEISFFVTVQNVGQTDGTDVSLRAFRGDPSAGVVVFEGVVTVPARSSSLVTFMDSLDDPEAAYTVVVDPDDAVAEADEGNNSASITVTSLPSIDLEVLPADIVLTAPSLVPGADITWDVTVRNRGTRDLPQNATVTYRVTDGVQLVPVLDESIFLSAGASRTRMITWRADLSAGLAEDLELVVSLDGGGVLETALGNNEAGSPFTIGAVNQPNLVVRLESLAFDPDPAREGQPLGITARVENTGGTVATDVAVAAFDGNPATGGALVAGAVTIASLAPGASELVTLSWPSVPDDQDRFLFVQVDPDDTIAEVLEDDNLAFRELVVRSLPDLAITPASLVLSPAFPRPGDTVTLVVTVANLGEQDASAVTVRLADGDPSAGGALLAPDQLIDVPGRDAGNTESGNATFTWTLDPASSGAVVASVRIDPDATLDERTRANNDADRTFAVQGADFFTSDRFVSPNGDGVRDTVQFFYRLPESIEARVEVRDRRDRTVRTFPAAVADGGDVIWDGRRDDGRAVRDGGFRFVVLEGPVGSSSTSAPGGTALGEAAIEVDTNRSPLLRAAGTPFESLVNMTCLLPRYADEQLTDDEQWLYLGILDAEGTAFQPGLYRVSTQDLRVREVSVEPQEGAFRLVTAADVSQVAWVVRNANATRYDLWMGPGDGSSRSRIGDTTTTFRRFPIAFDADASHLYYAEDQQLRRVAVDDPADDALVLTGGARFDRLPTPYVVSPDRRSLLLDVGLAGDRGVRRIDLETGAVTVLPVALDIRIASETFSPDGQRLVVADGDGDFAIVDLDGNVLQSVVIPEPAYPDGLAELGLSRSGLAFFAWSAVDDQLAMMFSHRTPGDPCFGLGEGVFSAQELLAIDLLRGDVTTVAWTEAQALRCESTTLPASGSSLAVAEPATEPATGPATASATGPAPGPKTAQEFLTSFGTLRWPANDEALFLDGVDAARQVGWSVFLGESGSDCDPTSSTPCIEDPENTWRFVAPGITDRSATRFSASGKQMLFESRRDWSDSSSPCFGSGIRDAFLMRSLANLTADLRLRRSQDSDAVVLEGTAADQNFDSYQLYYASSDAPETWLPIAPRSNRLVIDDFFQSWVPPGPGTWLVRLNVRDLAGNERDTVRQVASPSFPSLVDVFVEPEIFSPNSDGVRDQAVIHYRALEPVNVEAQIFDEAGNLAVLLTQLAPEAGVYELPWNGLDLSGSVVPDGRYTIRLAGFELPVRVDTTPVEVDLNVREPYTDADAITPGLSFRPRASRPEEFEIATEVLERGIGAFPASWDAYPFETADGDLSRTASVGYGAYTHARFRVRITDRAGNQTVSTSALGVEKLMILAAGDHRLAPDGMGFEALPPFVSTDPNRSAFGSLIEQQAGGVSQAFVVADTRTLRFALAETVVAGLSDFVVEVLNDAGAWVPYPVTSFVAPGSTTVGTFPTEHELAAVWAIPDVLSPSSGEGGLTVRLAARDALGSRFVTSGFEIRVPSTCPPISFRGRLDATLLARLESETACVEPTLIADIDAMLAENTLDFETDDVLVVLESVDGLLEGPELLLRSADDPRYGVWQAAQLVEARDGVVLFEADPAFASCTTYDGRATGGIPVTDPASGITTIEPASSEGAFVIPCISLFFAPELRQAEACGAAPPEIVDLYVRVADLTGDDDLALLEVRRSVSNGDDETLFSVTNPVSDLLYAFELGVSTWPKGVEEVVFHAANGDGATFSAAVPFVIDRTPPTISFDAPEEGAIVCGVADVLGSIEERVPSTESGLFPRIGDRTEAQAPGGEFRTPPTFEIGLPYVTVEQPGLNTAFTGLERGGPDRWTFEGRLAAINAVDGPATVRVSVYDQGGHLACAERSFVIDAFVPRPRVTIADPPAIVGTPTPFSPNGDGARDEVIFDYTLDEPGTVEVVVVAAGGGPVVRTLLPEQAASTGGRLVWDGRSDSGAVVADGIYGIQVRLRDACDNQEAQGISVEVDTVPPDVEILFPTLSDLDLPAIIDVSIRLAERYTNDVSFGESHDPTAWQAIGSCAVDGAIFTGFCLQRWNTVGLAGDWSLRMRATDRAGNQTTVIEPVRLPVRDDLITFLTPDPELFSPNGDERREEIAFRFGLVEPADIDLTIESEDGVQVAAVASERIEAASAARTWVGADPGGLPVPDGDYLAVLDARLVTDPTFQQIERVRFTLDRTPPSIVVDRPESDGFLRGDEAVLGAVTDTHLLAWTAFVASDDEPLAFVEIGSSENPETVPGTLGTLDDLEEGVYRLRVIADDAGEIRSEQETGFTVDNTLPEVMIDQPSEGRVVGAVQGPLEITGAVNDDHLAAWQLEVGLGSAPSAWTTLVSGGSDGPDTSRLIAWDLIAQADGLYTLRLSAEDRAGNMVEARRGIVIDNTPPDVALTAPAAGSFVTAPTVTTGTANDLHLVEYRLAVATVANGVPGPFTDIGFGLQNVVGGALATWSALPPDGEYLLRLSALDLPGNVMETTITVVVDTTPPAAPLNLVATIENGRDARLDWNDSPESDLVGYRVYRAGQPITPAPIPASAFLDPSLPEGEHLYRVTAVDQAGLESVPSNEASVEVDITPPTTAIFAPENGARVSGLVSVLGTAESQDFREYRLSVSPVSAPGASTELRRSPVTVVSEELGTWSTLGLGDGEPYRLRLEAEDLAGNIGLAEVVVTVDNEAPTPPTVLTATVVGSSGAGIDDVQLDWTPSDAPDLVGYLLYRDGRLVNGGGAAVGSLLPFALDATSFVDRDLADGTYSYLVYAIDEAENLSVPSNAAEAIVETGPPRATIVAPAAGSRFESTVFVEASSTDQDLASVQLQWRVGGGAWNDLGPLLSTAPFGAPLDPEALALVFGDVELRAVATDVGGLVDLAPAVVVVTYADLTAPEIPVARVAVDGGEVTVVWDPVAANDLAGYHVYRDFQRITTDLITETTRIETDVADRPFAYNYQVSAVDAEGNQSQRSNLAPALVFTPELDQPFTPTPILDTSLAGRGLRAGDTVTGTLVTATGTTVLAPATADADGFIALDVTWALGANTVTMVLEDAEGNRSRPVSRNVLAGEPPTAPTGLMATVADLDVSLNWNANPEPDLLGYRLLRDGVPALLDPVVDDFDHLVASSERAPSESAAATADGDLLTFWRPAVIEDQWVELGWPDARVVQQVRLQWNEQFGTVFAARDFRIQGLDTEGWITLARVEDNVDAVNEIVLDQPYRTDRIRLMIDRTFLQVQLAEVAVTTTALFDTGTLATIDTPGDGTFSYALTAWNALGFESLPSAPVGPVDVGDVIPPDPVVLSAQVVDDADVLLSWTASSDAVRYDLFRDGVKFAEHTDLGALSRIDAARPNGTYRYTAQAFDAAGNGSALSNEAVVVVAVAPPAAVSLTVVAPPEGDALDLAWLPATGSSPAVYRVLRALVSGGPYDEIALIDGTPPAITLRDTGVSNGVTYFYVVVARDALGNEGAFSNEASGTPENAQPTVTPVLHFPTVPGSLLVTENERATIIGRAGPGDDVGLLRDGVEVATARANAGTVIDQTFGDLFGPFEASHDGRFVFAPLFFGIGFGVVSDFENLFGADVAPEPTLGRFAAESVRFLFLSDAFGLGASDIFEQNLDTGVSRIVGSADTIHTFAVSPVDDRIIVLALREGQAGFWWLDATSGDWTLLAARNDIFSVTQASLRWSPDGTRVAFVRNTGAAGVLEVLDLATGSFETLDSATNVNIEPRFAPTSDRVAFVSAREGAAQIWAYDFASGNTTRLADVAAFDIDWSPDGTSIAYSEVDLGLGAVVVRSRSLTDGAVETLVASPALFNNFRWLPSGYVMVSNGGQPERHGLAGRFQIDDVEVPEGRNAFVAVARGESSEAIEIQRGDDDGGGDPEPDLRIAVSVIPAALPVGGTVRVSATIENASTVDAPASTVSMAVIGSGGFRLDLANEALVPALAAGASFVFGLEGVIDTDPGSLTAVATVDPRNLVTETNESNNSASAIITVLDGSAPALSTTTDRLAYAAGETVAITALVVGGVETFDGELRLTVEDEAGFVVETLPAVPVLGLSFAEQRTLEASWPTGATFAGAYRVRASLVAAGGSLAAEAVAAFDILGTSVLEATAVTDAAGYPVGAPVTVIGSFVYTSGNQPLTGAVARLTVLDDAESTITQWSEPLSLLLPGTQGALTRTWPGTDSTGSPAPAGRYRARFELLTDGTVRTSAETVFDLIAGASALVGELMLPATAPEVGEPLPVDFDIEEVGGATIGQVLARVLVLDAANLAELARTERTVDLVGGQATDSVTFDTSAFPLGNLLVVLEAAEILAPPAGVTAFSILDRDTSQVVDRTPPTVEVLAPAGGFLDVSSRAEVRVRDALSAIDRVEVQVDDGPWLTALLLTDDRYQRLLSGLEEGTHTVRARATDAAGNLGASDDVAFVVDRTPPSIEISGVTEGGTFASPAVPIVEVVELHPDTEDIRLDGATFVSGTPVTEPGPHVLSVIAVDQAGNRADAQVSFTVGALAPALVATMADALWIDADGDALPSPGDTLRYTVTVDNVGDGAATAVVFQDTLAAETQVVPGSLSSDVGSVVSETPVEIDLGTLAPAAVATITFDVSLIDPWPSSVTEIANQGSVSSAELPAVLTDDPDAPGTAEATVTAVFITPRLTIGDVAVNEGEPGDAVAANLTITLDRPGNRPVTLSFASADGTALAGEDYTAVAGTLELSAGTTEAVITVPIVSDLVDEPDETFFVNVDSAVGATVVDGEGIVTIWNDDTAAADASLAGQVWFDENRDGLVGVDEPALAGIGVSLVGADATVLTTTSTDVMGRYRFEALASATYTVEIDVTTLPVGVDDPTFDSDGTGTPSEVTVTLVSGEARTQVDFGYADFTCPPALDFERDAAGQPLTAGTLVAEQWSAFGIHVSTDDPAPHPAMLFDSAVPTGGDDDLGSPNADFGGPGVGAGGGEGRAGVNFAAERLVLIVSEDGDATDPDDLAGGTLIFDFDHPVDVAAVRMVDAVDGTITAFDTAGGIVGRAEIADLGENGAQRIPVDAIGVSRLEIALRSSGGVAGIVFCGPCTTLGFERDAAGNALPAGTILDDQLAPWGITFTTHDPAAHPPMIFDSAAPSGGDFDLGTPNQAFAGPGDGDGGGADRRTANAWGQGKVLIISEDADASDPDDNASGGTLIASFDHDVRIESITTLDVRGGVLAVFDAADALITAVPVPDSGQNALQVVPVAANGVRRLELSYPSSGALAGIEICAEQRRIEGDVLFVAGNTNLSLADGWMRSRLEGLGLSVTVVDDDAAETADGVDRSLIVVSSTVSSGKVGTAFRDLAVPVVTWESFLYDDLGMTGTASGTDFGNRSGQTVLEIVDGAVLGVEDLESAGVAGFVAWTDTATRFMWGRPSPDAWVAAALAVNDAKAGIFGYEAGSTMPGLEAPARRVALPFHNDSAPLLTPTAWRLFDAAIRWALGSQALRLEKEASLVLDADGNGIVSPGDTLRYTVTLRNDGEQPRADLVVRDELPEAVTLVAGSVTVAVDSNSLGGLLSESPLAAGIDLLAADETATITFDVVLASDGSVTRDAVSNQASLEAPGMIPLMSDDPTTPELGDATATAVFVPVQVTVEDASVIEGDGPAGAALTFTVALDAPSNRPLVIGFETLAGGTGAGSAEAGIDYLAVAGSEILPAGATTLSITVPVLGDRLDEGDETLRLRLALPGDPPWAALAQAEATGTIVDDDAGVVLTCLPDLDFDTDAAGQALVAGQIIDDEWASLGVTVTTDDPIGHPAMIFDSAAPTGGDTDLGAPNQAFGGPGVGSGGGLGQPGENPWPLGTILILSEDGDSSDPDDNAQGGTLVFSFATPVELADLSLLDASGGTVRAFDAGGLELASAAITNRGDNGLQRVEVAASGVSRLEVALDGSGGLSDLRFCAAPAPEAGAALLVAGASTLGAADVLMQRRLERFGYTVTVVDDDGVSSTSAAGMAIVAVSSTVSSGKVGSTFRDAAVPVVTWESFLYDDLGMAGLSAGSDFGNQGNQSSLEVVDGTVLGITLSGEVPFSDSGPYSWARPGPAAWVAAELVSGDSRATIFGYEGGANMPGTGAPGMVAPARRLGLALGNDTALSLTEAGWQLIDAALLWLGGAP